VAVIRLLLATGYPAPAPTDLKDGFNEGQQSQHHLTSTHEGHLWMMLGGRRGSVEPLAAPETERRSPEENVVRDTQRHRGEPVRAIRTVINVASFAGYLGNPGSAYSASKAWVLSFTDSVAASLVGTGVQAIAICAGQMRTGRHLRAGRPVGAVNSPLWLESADVVDRCLSDLRKQRSLSVPGGTYRIVVNLLELPRRSLRAVARVAGRSREQQAIRVRAPKEPETTTAVSPSVPH
jgi:NAD(P)-dependent dehydrogenase (short-subunit alcohol dehydrogenase family)